MAVYNPKVFQVADVDAAKSIILTPDDMSSEDRWVRETPFLRQDVGDFFKPSEQSVILDYGCGLGRLAKELISQFGCYVIGVDISTSMRQMAPGYVEHDHFFTCSREAFLMLVNRGLRVDGAYCLWVLQHCPRVKEDVGLITNSLKDHGKFYVLNNVCSAVPTDEGWLNDGVDIKALLGEHFTLVNESRLPESAASDLLSKNSFIGYYEKLL